MHVGGVDVVFLVPRGRGQQHVGHQRRTGHAEVQRQQQVEFALGRLLPPDHVLGAHLPLRLGGGDGVVGAEQVPQEVLVALGGVADQVGTPQGQGPGEVLGIVGVLDRELQTAPFELVDDVGGGLLPGGGGLVGQDEGALLELREERHPAQFRGLHVQVGGDLLVEQVVAELLGGEGVGVEGVVAVLVGVDVPVAGVDHLPGGPVPVQCEGHGGPSRDGTGLLLADVVGPAAPVAALAAAELDQRQHGPVDHVGVVPVVGAGPHDDHGTSVGVDRVLRELPGDPDDLRGGNVGDGLLPRGGVDALDVVVVLRPVSGQTRAGHAVLGQQQVEDGGDQPVPDPPHRHPAPQPEGLLGVVCEAGQLHLDHLVSGGVHHCQGGFEITQDQVPPARIGVAETVPEGAVGTGYPVGVLVPDERLEHGVGLLGQFPADIARNEVLARPVHPGSVFVEGDQERGVVVGSVVLVEERHPPFGEELLQHHMSQRHAEGRVGAGRDRHPLVGELGGFRVIGRHDHDLLAAVAGLDHPVGVGRTRQGHVRTPKHQVAGVPPVA